MRLKLAVKIVDINFIEFAYIFRDILQRAYFYGFMVWDGNTVFRVIRDFR